jgi:lysylphosphatidylglycerol synthetase-like protein (DUF2156 family)
MGSPGPYVADATERALTADERAQLSARLTMAEAGRHSALAKAAISSLLVCGVLAIFTLAVSSSPRWTILLFWSAVVIVFTLWHGVPVHRMMREHESMLSDALRTSRTREWRVQSERVVASVFVVGQQFYEDDDFPNSDFSILDLFGTHGRTVDSVLVKTGRKLLPARVVPAEVKRLVQIPDHLTVVGAPLDRVEAALPRARS